MEGRVRMVLQWRLVHNFSNCRCAQFKRLGNDLYSNVELDLYCRLGGESLLIPYLEKSIESCPRYQNGTKQD